MNTIEQWDNAAEIYTQSQEESEYARINKRIVMDRFKNLQGKTLLDLGCGYGWYTNYFTEAGAKATGCDGSPKMIKLARSRYPEIEFHNVDIEKPLPYNKFDIVFCNQVLMDISNIRSLVNEIYRVTASNGTFYMSIVHPAFYDCHWGKDSNGFCKTKIIEKYLSEYSFNNQFWGKTRHYHRTISYYTNLIINAGFMLKYLDEPVTYDNIKKSAEFPLFLFAEFTKI